MSTETERIVNNILQRFDQNDNETVTASEFKSALSNENVPENTATSLFQQVFQNWDKNDDASLSKSEVQKLASHWASFPGDQSKNS